MLNVLLAEDNFYHQQLALQALEGSGHHVTAVNNGEEALRALSAGTFDVVVLDLLMPIMDGLEFIRRVRCMSGHNADVPIVVVTAYGVAQHMEYFRRHRVSSWLDKPYDADELIMRIEAILN